MADFSVDISKYILTQSLLKFGPQYLIDTGPTLVQVMVWHFLGTYSLPKPMATQFTDVAMRLQASMCSSPEAVKLGSYMWE